MGLQAPAPATPTNDLLTVAQLAAWLQVSEFSVYNLTRHRSRREDTPLPYIKCGRALRFRRSSVEQWLAAREVR